jgi:uncharacterized membrane protein YbaN (DUF454 family)
MQGNPLRVLLIAAGLGSLALAAVGIFVPGLPTVPFLILSAYCFSRSSPRLHARLIQHPRLGPMISAWQTQRAIPRRAKIAATLMVMVSLTALIRLAEWPVHYRIAIASLISAAMLYVWTRPDGTSSGGPR